MSFDLKAMRAAMANYSRSVALGGAGCIPAIDMIPVMATEIERLHDAVSEMQRAVDFFDRVNASEESERAAVGRDHWDWLESAARKIAALTPEGHS